MKNAFPPLSRLKPLHLLALILLAIAVFAVCLSSLESILWSAPFLAIASASLASFALYAKDMLRFPWVLIPAAMWLKALSWAILFFYSPTMATEANWWPFTNNIYYGFDVLGSMLVLGFASYLLSSKEQRFFRHGLIADSSLLFLALILATLVFYYDIFIDYFETLNADNLLVRLQVIPFSYYFFISLAVVSTLGFKSDKKQFFYFFCIIPLSLHVYIEAYASYVFIPLEQQLFYARISGACYYLAALIIFIYILLVSAGDDKKTTTRSVTGLSPLIWIASSLALLLPTVMIFSKQLIAGEGVYSPYSYLLIFIASLAVFIRFSMLIIQARQQQKMLDTEASYDELTGILNRRGFMQKLTENKLLTTPNTLFCVLDVNNFKAINDTHGHHIGDQVLIHIADILEQYAAIPLSARLGGDEFVMVLQFGNNPKQSVHTLHHALASWQVFDNSRLYVGVSIGAAFIRPASSFPLLYTSADYALYQAKSDYSGAVLNKSELTAEQINARLIPDLIQDSLDQNRLQLHFQPIYNLSSGTMSSIEVLMRLYDDEGRLYMPSQFMDMARKHNQILPLTRLLLNKLVGMADQLPEARIAINFPPALFEDRAARRQIVAALDKLTGLKSRLSLEITEEFNSDVQVLGKVVSALRKQGYCFALDDFGAGSASLSRLAYLSVDMVKIDISLLRAAEQGNIAPLESVVALSKRLNSQVVVEGIETPQQLDIARQVKADMGQGYMFSKPVELKELIRLPQILPELSANRLSTAY